MPQEIEVWEILPAIRKEFAKELICEHKLSQKDAAKLLNITDAAVSQYLRSKRASNITFGEITLKEIKKSTARIVKEGKSIMEEMQKICRLPEVRQQICKLHKKQSKSIPEGCSICLK